MKRQKTVYSSNQELAHVWSTGEISNGRANNMFFENGIMYSYGYHYEAAKRHGNITLLNSKRYSNSTAKHLSIIRQAVSHSNLIEVPEVNPLSSSDHSSNIDYLISRVCLYIDRLYSQKTEHLEFSYLVEDIELYLHTFDEECPDWEKIKEELGSINIDELIDFKRFKDREKINKKEEAKRVYKEKLDLAIKESADEIEMIMDVTATKWRQNEIPSYELNRKIISVNVDGKEVSLSFNDLVKTKTSMIRIVDDQVETSNHANVPLSHALRLLKAIESRQAKRGERIGHYTFAEVIKENGEEVVVIGCHKILLSEARAVLSQVIDQKVVQLNNWRK